MDKQEQSNTPECGLETAIAQIAWECYRYHREKHASSKMHEFIKKVVPIVIQSYKKSNNGFEVFKGQDIIELANEINKEIDTDMENFEKKMKESEQELTELIDSLGPFMKQTNEMIAKLNLKIDNQQIDIDKLNKRNNGGRIVT